MELLVAVVGKNCCKSLKTEFEKMGIFDKTFSIKRSTVDKLCIPLLEKGKEKLESYMADDDSYTIKGLRFHLQYDNKNEYVVRVGTRPSERLVMEVKKLLERRGVWTDNLNEELPKSWEQYGDLVLFDSRKHFLSPIWNEIEELWPCICSALNVKRIGIKSQIKSDNFRSPRAHLVWGNNSWVNYTDNGILYSWDIERNMFSAGNAPERHRIATLKCQNEVVVDMYAGIGYFTLPFLIHCNVELVHALEWNPDAVKALKINLQQNGVSHRCIIYEGDSLKLCPRNVADRVNLGLLPSSEAGWKTACAALKTLNGGVLHIHENIVSRIKSETSTHEDAPDIQLKHHKVIILCDTCRNILKQVDLSETLISNTTLFCHSPNSFAIKKHQFTHQNVQAKVNWKNVEWKMWALHVCHRIGDHFEELYGESVLWTISVNNLHHVKSYAPHIDHLVLDVSCTPVWEC